MIDHIVRRGVQHASGMAFVKRAVEDIEMPKLGLAVLVGTFIVMVMFLSAVEYTLKDVVATLAMVETPSAAITISTPDEPADKHEKEGLLETAPTMTLVHQKPITSSIRATIKHIVAQGGRLARFRGFRYHLIWTFAYGFAANVLASTLIWLPFGIVFGAAAAGALTANLHAAWTHRVISMPSTTSFWQSVPSRSSWKVLALPAAVVAGMPYVTLYVLQGAVQVLGLNKMDPEDIRDASGAEITSIILRGVAVILLAITCTLFLHLPAFVTLIRVEASILPESEDTIVPFDRTFEGKVVPRVLGGSGSIGFVDAWRSFNWEARRRLLGLFIKIWAIMTGLVVILVHVWAVVGFVAMGSTISKVIAEAQKGSFRA